MVAGAKLFVGNDFMIDFANRRMYVRGDRAGVRGVDVDNAVRPPSRLD